MKRNRKFIALAAVAALSLSLSAMAPVVSATPAQRNIVQTAFAAGQFKTLTKLVKQAGLAGALQGKGPFTGRSSSARQALSPRWAALPASVEPGVAKGDR